MKTKKVKMMMPLLAMAFAIAGAFATNSLDKDKGSAAPIVGYLDAPTPCSIEIQCSTIPGPLCTDGDVQAFGKSSSTICAREVYLPMN